MVPLVPAAFEERGRFGVGPGHDQPGNVHDVELEAGRVEPLDLLVHADEHLAALVTAFLGAGLLVLDVVAGDANLDEAPDQIPDVGVAAVPGVGIGDDERPEVGFRRGRPLGQRHPRAGETLVAVRREQRAHDRRGLLRHLGERIAGQVRAGVLGDRSLGRRRPAAQVDAHDAHPLHRHGLAGGVRPECGDLRAFAEEFPQPYIELLGRYPRDRVVDADGSPLLYHLAGGMQARDAVEPRTGKPPAGLADLRVKRWRSRTFRYFKGYFSHRRLPRGARVVLPIRTRLRLAG